MYGSEMHGFVLDEAELGSRVASGLDQENNCKMGVWVDISYEAYCRERGWVEGENTTSLGDL